MDWKKIKLDLEAIPLDPVTMSPDIFQKAMELASEAVKSKFEAAVFSAFGVPKSLLFGDTNYASTCANASTTVTFKSVQHTMRRFRETTGIARGLPSWITHNRGLLADDLWFAGESFSRSIAALAVVHRLKWRSLA